MIRKFDDLIIDRIFQPFYDWLIMKTGIPVFLVARELWLGCLIIIITITTFKTFNLSLNEYFKPNTIIFYIISFYGLYAILNRYKDFKKKYDLWLDDPERFAGVIPKERLNHPLFRTFLMVFLFVITIPKTIKIWMYPPDDFITQNLNSIGVLMIFIVIYTEACASMPPPTKQKKFQFAHQNG